MLWPMVTPIDAEVAQVHGLPIETDGIARAFGEDNPMLSNELSECRVEIEFLSLL